MTQIVQVKEQQANILATLNDPKVQRQIAAALPGVGVRAETFARWCTTALRRQPKLLKCDKLSLLGAMVQSAQLGLDPSGVTGEAYLVPYGNECTLIPGYKGLIRLAYRSGLIASIDAHVVHEKDIFSYEYGAEPRMRHVPFDGDEPGPLTHAYATARIKNGGTVFLVLTARDIANIRACSASAKFNDSPWEKFTEAMWLKSAVRHLSKLLPMSVEVAKAFELSADDERGIPPIVSLEDFEVYDDPKEEPALAAAGGSRELTDEERDRQRGPGGSK